MSDSTTPKAPETLDAETEALREEILLAILAQVPFEGWTEKTMARGAEAAGHGAAEARIAFPGGLRELAAYWSRWADRRMEEEMAALDTGSMRIRDRIATAVRLRIMVNARHREAVRRCLSWLALPMNAGIAARNTACTVNAIWYAAGDTSADWNYYTKRGLLAPVYTTTVLYWLADEADETGDYPATWAYLARRIDDVIRAFSLPKRLKDAIGRRAPLRPGAARRRHAGQKGTAPG